MLEAIAPNRNLRLCPSLSRATWVRFSCLVLLAFTGHTACHANLVSNTNSQATHSSIQAAVHAAEAGDTLLVSPGTYTERVFLNKDLTIIGESASNTVVQAATEPGVPIGRVVTVSGGTCVLEELTIRHGFTRDTFGLDGAGVYSASARATTLRRCVLTANIGWVGGGAAQCRLESCVITDNEAGSYGGGASDCVLVGCSVTENLASDGGGASGGVLTGCAITGNEAMVGGGVAGRSVLRNCTLTDNRAHMVGGGAYSSALTNCIVYYNTSPVGPSLFESTAAYSCLPEDPGGVGNLIDDPQLVSAFRISPSSPCVGGGDPAYASGTDIDGDPWGAAPSMGCDEPVPDSSGAPLRVRVQAEYMQCATDYPIDIRAEIAGKAEAMLCDFGDGSSASNRPFLSHAWTTSGTYNVTITAWNPDFPAGVTDTVAVEVIERPVHHVAEGNPGALFPFASWETAAAVLQDGVDAAVVPGALVLVSNGTYATGGSPVDGGLSNRVAIISPVTVRSLHGPEVTFITGESDHGQLGEGARRCAYVGATGVLEGFTLSNGYTRASAGYPVGYGGGAFVDTRGGKLIRCLVTGNQAYHGGGVTGGLVHRCRIRNNTAHGDGGGVAGGVARNCVISENSADGWGGGSKSGVRVNSTIVSNTAEWGEGTSSGMAIACIIYDNGDNPFQYDNYYSTRMYRCCTYPLPDPSEGQACITGPPGFAWLPEGDMHLTIASPCIDAGGNPCEGGEEDMDGLARVAGAAVDIGAYEYADRDGDGMPDYWEIRHDLDPEDDGSVDPEHGAGGDPDSDRATNLHEFQTWTRPRDGNSAFVVVSSEYDADANTCGVTVRTEPGRTYTVEYLDLPPPGYLWKWGIFRQNGTWLETSDVPAQHTFVDDYSRDTTGGMPDRGTRFYRVKQQP